MRLTHSFHCWERVGFSCATLSVSVAHAGFVALFLLHSEAFSLGGLLGFQSGEGASRHRAYRFFSLLYSVVKVQGSLCLLVYDQV